MSDPDALRRYAEVGLANVAREYPNHPGHLLTGPADLATPRQLHPVFYGCYDWHSAVHQHWMLARLLRCAPDLPQAPEIAAWFAASVTPETVAVETGYFAATGRRSFERPYGWSWLLFLDAELAGWPGGRPVAARLAPLTRLLRDRALEWLRGTPYPARTGLHGNSAFAATLLVDVAAATADRELEAAVRDAAHRWYAADGNYPAWLEPSATDFLSPALTEADLMTRLMDRQSFGDWFSAFLPDPGPLRAPPTVADPTDPQTVHLAGLSLSRAWAWARIGRHLPAGHPQAEPAAAAAERHRAGLSGAVGGDYVGEHWLPTFAVYLLLGGLTDPAEGAGAS